MYQTQVLLIALTPLEYPYFEKKNACSKAFNAKMSVGENKGFCPYLHYTTYCWPLLALIQQRGQYLKK